MNRLGHELLFIVNTLVIFHVNSFVPVPNVSTTMLTGLLRRRQNAVVRVFGVFSNNTLDHTSVFTLKVVPCVSTSVVVRLLAIIRPALTRVGGRKRSNHHGVDRCAHCNALILTVFRSVNVTANLPGVPNVRNLIVGPNFTFCFATIMDLIAKAVFLV